MRIRSATCRATVSVAPGMTITNSSPPYRANIKDAHAGSEEICDVTQNAVPFEMSARVIDALEIIDVDQQQRKVLFLPAGALNFGFETGFKVAPVEKTRDSIYRRKFGQA